MSAITQSGAQTPEQPSSILNTLKKAILSPRTVIAATFLGALVLGQANAEDPIAQTDYGTECSASSSLSYHASSQPGNEPLYINEVFSLNVKWGEDNKIVTTVSVAMTSLEQGPDLQVTKILKTFQPGTPGNQEFYDLVSSVPSARFDHGDNPNQPGDYRELRWAMQTLHGNPNSTINLTATLIQTANNQDPHRYIWDASVSNLTNECYVYPPKRVTPTSIPTSLTAIPSVTPTLTATPTQVVTQGTPLYVPLIIKEWG